jgi:hypothetical protein
MLAAILSLEMQAAKARTEPDRSGVNRTLKGNRLPLIPNVSNLPTPQSRTDEPRLPEGCVADIKAAPNLFWVEVPGRCVSAIPVTTSAFG